ncbi:MAG: aminofutalosine synthase MqnE [Planctomycetes bacterium]|nr:aminofutalosine synthase MqnE [Planctomycetota bacterium]
MDLPADSLAAVSRKVERGERLSFEDGVLLYKTADLAAVGALANAACERRHGGVVTYNVNRHINYSNLCTDECMFCAFGKKRGEAGAYEFTMDDILARAAEAVSQGADELHMVGGLHPDLPYDFYPAMLAALKERFPALHLKCFTAVEIDYFASLTGWPVERVLADLIAHGLGSMPGGGAEVFSDRIQRKIFRTKIKYPRWFEIHAAAHRLGLKTNMTMLYGHIETAEEKVTHLIRGREAQDRSGGFLTFIPLLFHPENTALRKLPKARPIHSLREIAVARLMADNVPHVKTYWIMTGLETAQIALTFGADDIDGTVVEEKITHMAGAVTPEGVTESFLRALIADAGKTPRRRDTLYRPLAPPAAAAVAG